MANTSLCLVLSVPHTTETYLPQYASSSEKKAQPRVWLRLCSFLLRYGEICLPHRQQGYWADRLHPEAGEARPCAAPSTAASIPHTFFHIPLLLFFPRSGMQQFDLRPLDSPLMLYVFVTVAIITVHFRRGASTQWARRDASMPGVSSGRGSNLTWQRCRI